MCGIFGVFDYLNRGYNLIPVLKELGENSYNRGQDATGLSTINKNGEIEIVKSPFDSFKFDYNQIYQESNIYIGHVRMATCGKPEFNFNNHPFISKNRSFALAHNGILYNHDKIRADLNIDKNKIETDTYLAVQILDKYKSVTLKSMKYLCENIEGDFVFTILNKNKEIFIARKNNPIVIYDFYKMGLLIYASTKEILNNSIDIFIELNKEKKKGRFKSIKINDGEILKIKKNGQIEKEGFNIPIERYGLLNIDDEYTKNTILCEECKDYDCEKCIVFDEMYNAKSQFGGDKYDLSQEMYNYGV